LLTISVCAVGTISGTALSVLICTSRLSLGSEPSAFWGTAMVICPAVWPAAIVICPNGSVPPNADAPRKLPSGATTL
jgi:hypothetical protein